MPVEESHTAMTSGLAVEGRRVPSAAKPAAAVAVRSVPAVARMNLRLAARDPVGAGRPAAAAVPPLWVAVPTRRLAGRPADWTVADFWVGLARLGGYLKSPAIHPPGGITVWRGWMQLQALIDCHLAMT